MIVGIAAWFSESGPGSGWDAILKWPPQAWAWLAASLLMVSGAAAAAVMRQRLAVLMASGLVGYGAAILFLFAGAPDLAFTQFSVETALVIVAAAVLPSFAPALREPQMRGPSREWTSTLSGRPSRR